ncbi:hypothetical protein [Cellulomonas sp. NPDC089187]|uniref:hypothetical protein n=1 Tax=Cellulomonas sp. NPDC089187 TaxID=3154970 RepID=UPI003420E95A
MLRLLRGMGLGGLLVSIVLVFVLREDAPWSWWVLWAALIVVAQAIIVALHRRDQSRTASSTATGAVLNPVSTSVSTTAAITVQPAGSDPSVPGASSARTTLVLTLVGVLLGGGAQVWLARDALGIEVAGITTSAGASGAQGSGASAAGSWATPTATAQVWVPDAPPSGGADGTDGTDGTTGAGGPLSGTVTDTTAPGLIQAITASTGSTRLTRYDQRDDITFTEVVMPDSGQVHDITVRAGSLDDDGPTSIPPTDVAAESFDVSEVDWSVVESVRARAEELAGGPVTGTRITVARNFDGVVRMEAWLDLADGSDARIELDLAGQVTRVW